MAPEAAAPRPTESVPCDVPAKPPADRERRKVEGWCLYSSACPKRAEGWPDASHSFCTRHRLKEQKRDARRKRESRAELAQAGKCTRCRRPSSTWRCPGCRIADQTTLPTNRVRGDVPADLDPWRRDNDGWQRYRGKGRRGPPPAARVDSEELQTALESLERGRNALAYANSETVKALGRDQHKTAKAAAASILGMASRMIEDIAVRNLPTDHQAVSLRGKVREALGEGVDQEVIDDRMVDRVIAAVRDAEPTQARGRR